MKSVKGFSAYVCFVLAVDYLLCSRGLGHNHNPISSLSLIPLGHRNGRDPFSRDKHHFQPSRKDRAAASQSKENGRPIFSGRDMTNLQIVKSLRGFSLLAPRPLPRKCASGLLQNSSKLSLPLQGGDGVAATYKFSCGDDVGHGLTSIY